MTTVIEIAPGELWCTVCGCAGDASQAKTNVPEDARCPACGNVAWRAASECLKPHEYTVRGGTAWTSTVTRATTSASAPVASRGRLTATANHAITSTPTAGKHSANLRPDSSRFFSAAPTAAYPLACEGCNLQAQCQTVLAHHANVPPPCCARSHKYETSRVIAGIMAEQNTFTLADIEAFGVAPDKAAARIRKLIRIGRVKIHCDTYRAAERIWEVVR